MTANELLVRAERASRTFATGHDPVHAVRAATFVVHPGEQIALVGASGSGKSTLLHLIAGLDRQTDGVLDWPALSDAPLRPGPLAVVFQAPSLLQPLDVLENVALPLLLLGVNEDIATAEAERSLERLGLVELAHKLPEELSGGQAQRVAVARALVSAPALILADEPTGQLDSTSAAEVIDSLLETSASTGAALIVATHDPQIATRLQVRWTMIDGELCTTDEAESSCLV